MSKLLIYSAAFAFIYMAFIRVVWMFLCKDGLFDTISNGKWGEWKDYLYERGNKFENILGTCAKCTAFWWAFPFLTANCIIMYYLGDWPFSLSITGVFVGSMWFGIAWFMYAMAGLISLSKKFIESV